MISREPLTVGSLTSRIEAMTEGLRHRGPDDAGTWSADDGRVALGHRRLSVVDLSPRGHQPMVSACGRYALTFNGEIYNHSELRASLERRGRTRFQGSSDTEVLLEAMSLWGVQGALGASNGMFGLGVWDLLRREMTLARDRLGEKPLYYGRVAGDFAFASEITSIQALPGFSSEVDRSALMSFLQFAYVPAPFTIFKDIRKLPPGTYVTIGLDGHGHLPTPYWSLSGAVASGLTNRWSGTDAEAVDHLDSMLRQSVGLRMQADVPLGVFLSGGIDSSTVVAEMQAQTTSPVLTFTIGFEDSSYDETAQAKEVADHLGTQHTEMTVSSQEAADIVPRLPRIYGEPFADVSQIPTFVVSELARRDVVVALSGDGGDELFGGYTRYAAYAKALKWLRPIPLPLRQRAAAGIDRVSPERWRRLLLPLASLMPDARSRMDPGVRMEQLASALRSRDARDVYASMVTHWRSSEISGGGPEVAAALGGPPRPGLDPFSYGMYVDSVSYLPDDILTKLDRASMAVSLECRLPLLDHRLVEFAWSLPLSLKYRAGRGKWLLRQVLARYLPREMYDRPKMGFGVPIGNWLRSSLRPWAEDLLDPVRMKEQGYVNPTTVMSAWDRHLAGSNSGEHRLWAVLMFQAWLEEQ